MQNDVNVVVTLNTYCSYIRFSPVSSLCRFNSTSDEKKDYSRNQCDVDNHTRKK